MATTIINRGVYALVPLLAIPVGMEQLGVEGFGAWVTALSTASLITFADLGVGTGLMTRLGAGSGLAAPATNLRRQVSSAYALVALIATACMCLLLVSYWLVDWRSVLNAQSSSHGSQLIVTVTLSAFVSNMVASLVTRVQYGVGQQACSNLWQAAGNVLMLFSIFLVSGLSESRPLFIWVAAYVPVALALCNTAHFFLRTEQGKGLAPRIRDVSASEMGALFGLGRRFVVISLLMTITVAADPWIVAHTTELVAVPDYVIPYRIFATVGSVCVMLSLPLWPLHSGAVAKGDVRWIRVITRRMMLFCGFFTAVVSAIALWAGPSLLERWLPESNQVTYDAGLWVGLACWWLAQSIASPAFMVQNGAEVLGPQTVGYAIVLISIPVKWYVSASFGFELMPWVSLAFYCVAIWPSCRLGYLRSLSIAQRNAEHPPGRRSMRGGAGSEAGEGSVPPPAQGQAAGQGEGAPW